VAIQRFNNVSGTAATNPVTLAANGTTATWASAPAFPTVTAPNVAKLIVEGDTSNEEVTLITAYTAGALTATVTRNAELTALGPTTAVAHNSVAWRHGPTALDFSYTPNIPAFLHFAGHSYLNLNYGLPDPSFRLDNLVCAQLNISQNAKKNRAVAGSALLYDGAAAGGYTTILQQIIRSRFNVAPYVGQGGAYVHCQGINDMGNLIPSSDYPAKAIYAKVRNAAKHGLRTVISRYRAAATHECGGAEESPQWAYTGWNAGLQTSTNSGTGVRYTSAVGAVATFTIPADFPGGAIAIGAQGSNGAFGATAAIGGTFSQGAAGRTIVTSNFMPYPNYGHVCTRLSGLPASDAGKTITVTTTAVDSGGYVNLDYAQIEATVNIPLVVICNIARLTANYGTKYPFSYWANASNNGATGDADVADFNLAIREVVAEFDTNVVIADIDSALGKNPANFGDGLHPSQTGTPLAAQAVVSAITNAPVAPSAFNQSNPAALGRRKGRASQSWYGPDITPASFGTYTMVTGDVFAFPVEVTEAVERWDGFSFEVVTASVGGTPLIRGGIYNDVDWTGAPQLLIADLGTTWDQAVTVAGTRTSPNINQWFDPSNYWLVLKVEAAGTTTAGTLNAVSGSCLGVPMSTAAAPPIFGGTPYRVALKATGLAAGALPGVFPAATAIAGPAPVIIFRRA